MSARGRSHHARRRGAPRASAGLTLIELVIVMALAALVLGMGLGAISRIDLGARAAVSTVQSALRSANNWAVARRAPARVRIDAAARTLTAEGQDVIGTWHFEDSPPSGAFELDGELIGAELVDDGFLGRALGLRGRGANARFEVAVQRSPAYELSEGFQLQLALRPEEGGTGRVLQLGETLGVEVGRDMALSAWFTTVREAETGATVAGGRARASTEAGALPIGRWSRVLIGYDRTALTVAVEGVELARAEEQGRVAPIEGPLVVGGGQRPWPGSVDCLVISAVSTEETIALPAPKELRYVAGGGLDRRVHRGPVRFQLEFLEGEAVPIQVNLYGGVE